MSSNQPPTDDKPVDKASSVQGPSNDAHRRTVSLSDSPKPPRSPRPHLKGTLADPNATPVQTPSEFITAPNSAASESAFGMLSPGATDRVFPIRSVVSVDPTQTPQARSEASDQPGDFPGFGSAESSFSSSRRPESRRYSINSTPSQKSEPSKSGSAEKLSNTTQRTSTRNSTSRSDSVSVEGRESTGSGSGPQKPNFSRTSKQFQLFSDVASIKSEGASSINSGLASTIESRDHSMNSAPGHESTENGGGIVTARFKHVATAEGHKVITGRDGETLQRCEDEPIHIPGAVQGFGLLIALREEAEGRLAVRIVSENSKRIIGFSPRELFQLESFCDVLSEEQAENLLDHIDFIRDEEADPATNGPEVFTLSIRPPHKRVQKLWCAIHMNEKNPNLIICEFELDDDKMYPLVPNDESTPEPPEDTLNSNPTAEELAESTVNASRPLRVLRSARKRKGEAAAMEVFNIMSQVQEQLASATNLDAFLKILVGVVKELTGFHRVMIYQFDSAWNGRVVTELLDPRATKDLYKGLNFPASDIPKQARDLYKINKVRLLYDRDQQTARLVCREAEDLEIPLDLTYSYLRAMSPIHTKYLANMGVRGSMSISINAFNELWGLISCHAYGSKGMRVSFPIRKMCRLVGDSASRNIERLSYASRLQARKLINTVPTERNPSGYIIASSDDLLSLFDADFGMLAIRDETKILGKLEQSQEALAMLEYLRLRRITSVQSSQDLNEDFPDLRYPPGFHVIAGLLLVPLAVSGTDFIVFFRKGQQKEVKWAGNPYEKFIKEGTEGYLEPRKSFKTWSETVVGKCREWTDEQVETAAVLCLVYGKFIEVWRQKEAAVQSSQLTRLLLANSAHEVRTPLNAIINYLEIALEGSLDHETRENLARSHSASKSLIYVINDLLDLTKTEEGGELNKDEPFDLPSTVREATDMFAGDAKRKQIDFEVFENPGLPRMVIGDSRRVRQIVSNVTANAIQHTTEGAIRVELWLAQHLEETVDVDIVVQDTGSGMSPKKLDALFRDLEQVQTEGEDILEDTPNDPSMRLTDNTEGKEDKEKRTLGLGLALVARIVRNMNGQIRLKSEEGKGSRFVIQLPFGKSPEEAPAQIAPPPGTPQHAERMMSPAAVGEMTLVASSANRPKRPNSINSVGRRNSAESVNSLKSFKTHSSGKSGRSAKSDVDRLIDAIQEPQMVSGEQRINRPGSRGSKDSSMDHPKLQRHKSQGSNLMMTSTEPLQSPTRLAGQSEIMDTKTPIKPVKMSDYIGTPAIEEPPQLANASRVLFDTQKPLPRTPAEEAVPQHYNVLVAEDDPVNSKIIKKRLEKAGHEVQLTVNGEECASMYGGICKVVDVILMDMQMPIVDGLSSTKMIRSFEKSNASKTFSRCATLNGRVPIFAVSASLVERDRGQYSDAGFDGWILKPIDFKRLTVLLAGITDLDQRREAVYKPGDWEKGGWFGIEKKDFFSTDTVPSGAPAAAQAPVADKIAHEDGQSMNADQVQSLPTPASVPPANKPGSSAGQEPAKGS
ncbi:MAG: Light-sensor Protein kinase [Chaenotheca gracillima]|nr:MAG: Light-sensor Protein kinase [Chaenotheca gracillima]